MKKFAKVFKYFLLSALFLPLTDVYGTTFDLPGDIQAEDFTGYYDTTAGNALGYYRTDVDVDINKAGYMNYSISRFSETEYLDYTVNVSEAGYYIFSGRIATLNSGSGVMNILTENDTGELEYRTSIHSYGTNGWEAWRSQYANDLIYLQAGIQTIRIYSESNPINHIINSFVVERAKPHTAPGIIEAEDFINAYDETRGNSGGDYRLGDVDITQIGSKSDYYISYFNPQETLTYNITALSAGQYQFLAKVAKNNSVDAHFQIEIESSGEIIDFNFSNTGGWDLFEQVLGNTSVELLEGDNKIKLTIIGDSSFKLDDIEIQATADIVVPGRFEAEHFISATDSTPTTNYGGDIYPNDYGVDIYEGNGGAAIGRMVPGETLTYEVYVKEAGFYNVLAKYALDQSDPIVEALKFTTASGNSSTFNFRRTGGNKGNWEIFRDVLSEDEVYFEQGLQQITFEVLYGPIKLDALGIVRPHKFNEITSEDSGLLSAQDYFNAAGMGVNIGNTFDTGARTRDIIAIKKHIDFLHDRGFNHIRLPVTWFATSGINPRTGDYYGYKNLVNYDASTGIASFEDDPSKSATTVVQSALEAVRYAIVEKGMYVQLNAHHEEWLRIQSTDETIAANSKKLAALWTTISNHFEAEFGSNKEYQKKLSFEILNEPHAYFSKGSLDTLERQHAEEMVRLVMLESYNAIRAISPRRVILLAAADYSEAQRAYRTYNTYLDLPSQGKDRYLAIEVHHYQPHGIVTPEMTYNSNYTVEKMIAATKGSFWSSITQWDIGIPLHFGEFAFGRKNSGSPDQLPYSQRFSDIAFTYIYTMGNICALKEYGCSIWSDEGWFKLVDVDLVTQTDEDNNQIIIDANISPYVCLDSNGENCMLDELLRGYQDGLLGIEN